MRRRKLQSLLTKTIKTMKIVVFMLLNGADNVSANSLLTVQFRRRKIKEFVQLALRFRSVTVFLMRFLDSKNQDKQGQFIFGFY